MTSKHKNLGMKYCEVFDNTQSGGATTHKLTYAAGDHGTYDGSTTHEFDLVESTGTQTVKSPSDVGISENTGYVFAKWNDGTADYLPGSTYTMGTADATLTAQWVAGVALSYDGNGATAGSTATTYVASGGTQTVANNGFTAPSGKEFKEWNTLSTGLGTSYNPGSEIENFTSPLTLYAIWKNISHVDFDATADRGATALTLTKSDITLTISDGTLSNGSEYRIFKGKTLTVSRSSGKMSSIIFTCTANGTSQYGPGCFTTASGYTYSGNTGTWEGAANSVTFTASSNQVRATKIVVNYYEGSDVTLDKTSLTLMVNGSNSTITVSEIDGVTNPTYQWARVSGDDCVTLTNANTDTVTVAPKGSAFATCGLTLTVNGDNLEDPIVREASVYVARNSSAEAPYTIVEAKKAIDLDNETYISEAHVHGIVSTTPTLNSDNSLTYWISDDGTTANQLQVFKGVKSDGSAFAYATDVEIAGQVTVKGTLKKYSSTYEFDAGNRLVAYTAPVRVLSSIALSGTYPTQFLTGDAFSHAGMVVTATYDDDTQRDVTNYATFSGYNMAEAGTQEVTVSYEENDVTKTATYNITLTYVERTNYNLYQESEIAEGDYIFYYDGYSIKNTIVNGRASYETVQVVDNVISNYHTTNIWHIARNGEYYTIYNANVGKYLASTDSNNKAKLEDDVTNYSLWTATMSQAGTYEFVNKARDAANGNKYLRNNGDNGWACYSGSTGGELKLFKRETMSYLKDAFATEATLLANETNEGVDSVSIKFTTKVAKYVWDTINSEYGISEFGMMGYGTRKASPSTVAEKFDAEQDKNNPTTLLVINADTYGLTLDEEGDYYTFTVKVNISGPSNYDLKFIMAPYVVVDGAHHFLDNMDPSVNYLAQNGLVESQLSAEALATLSGQGE